MELTDEMRSEIAAIWINVAYAARPSRAMQDAAERTILAGYRMGQRDMRERAAKVCDGVNNYDNPMTAGDCADTIRSLPVEDANG